MSNADAWSRASCLRLRPTYLPTYIHTYIQTYIHTYLPTYLHTYSPPDCGETVPKEQLEEALKKAEDKLNRLNAEKHEAQQVKGDMNFLIQQSIEDARVLVKKRGWLVGWLVGR